MTGTVTLNPCIDRTCCIDGFTVGGMNRIISDRRDISGKGINVSLALKELGEPVLTSGFLYSGSRSLFLEGLKNSFLDYRAVEVDGYLRENIKLWDKRSDITTEVNQKGAFVPEDKVEAFISLFSSFVGTLDTVVLSGSVPEGVRRDIYRILIERANEKGVKCILDGEGDLLLSGLEARPFLIKPNEYEFISAFAPKDGSLEEIAKRAKEIVRSGLTTMVSVTLGRRGALLTDGKDTYFASPPEMEVKCTQGAGDSVVAGFSLAMAKGKTMADMLRYGVAAASGTLMREGTEMCRKEDFMRILPQVKVKSL